MYVCVLGEREDKRVRMGPAALDVSAAFFESSLRLRVAFVLLVGSTLVLGILTAVGGAGVYDL